MKRIKTKNIMGTFLFVPFLKPSSLLYLAPSLDTVFNILLIFSLCFLIIQLMTIKNIHLDKFFWGICFFWGIHFIGTYINNAGDEIKLITIWLKIMTMYFFIKIELLYKRISINCMLYPLNVLLILNIITFIIYPNGMYTMYGSNGSFYSNLVWILGGKNGYFYYIFFALFLYIVKGTKEVNYKKNNSLLYRLFFLLIIISNILISRSATLIVGTTIVSICFLNYKTNFIKGKVITNYLIFILFLMFIFISIGNEDSILNNIVSEITGKTPSFSGRTYIWERTIEAIKNNWLFGYGIENPLKTVEKIRQSTSHNKYLWIIYRGGVIATLVFCYLLYSVYKNLRHSSIHNKKNSLFLCMFITLCVLWHVEVYDNNPLIFGFLLLCYYIDNLILSVRSK